MRALIISKDKTIGHCLISRTKLINGKRSKTGAMVLYGDLVSPSNKAAGKIKIIYEILDQNFLDNQQAAGMDYAPS